ncbi:MAG: phosphatidate cytidylyltransferase [Candidatus Dependentiae bacterium]|nr:phosphatidate cytidylyltransferase [Candidatus Dependentiae bacterium]
MTQRIITGTILAFLFWVIFFKLPVICFSLILGCILAVILIVEWPRLLNIKQAPFWLLMPLYPIMPFVCMILMNQDKLYHELLFFLFIIVPIHDTGSYFAGSWFGKHKIAPTISPGKTWEGFFGGLLITYCNVFLILWYLGHTTNPPFIIIFTFIICALSLCGDLFESWLKRRAHIKDSGTLLPGHGGLLDRFDGIMFGALFFFLTKDYLLIAFGIR